MLSFIEFLREGNPLARHVKWEKEGRHFVTLSATRKHLSDKENLARNKELKSKVKALGYGYRNAKGMWEGGEEDSIAVYAKGVGPEHGAQLHKDMKALSTHYDQDSFLQNDAKTGKLHGTNDVGFPGRGNEADIGPIRYNVYNKDGMTAYYPRREPEQRQFFTMKDKK